jgi:clan AA aspartic protease (TIGR02281 family)
MQPPGKTANYYRPHSATVAAFALTIIFGLTPPCYAGGNNAFTGGFVGGIVGGIVGGAIQQQQYYQQQYYQQLQRQQYYQQQQQQQYYYQQQQDAVTEEQRERAAAKKKAQRDKDKQQNQQDQAKLTPPVTNSAGSGPISITMKRENGILWVPAQINKSVAINFIVDSGAADVTIPVDVFLTLMRTGTISDKEKVGEGKFTTADGSVVEGIRFKLATLQVGDQTLTDVIASVIPKSAINSDPLLGQSFLSRFKSWSVDNNSGTLNLVPQGGDPTATPPQTQVAGTGSPPTAAPQAQVQPVSATAGPTSISPAGPATTPTEQTPSSTPPKPAEKQEMGNSSLAAAKDVGITPSFPPNTAYSDARHSLMALGYEPAPLPDAAKCDQTTDKTCFPEREACTSDNGTQCEFFWKRGERLIKVTTTAVPPTVSSVGCQINCQ